MAPAETESRAEISRSPPVLRGSGRRGRDPGGDRNVTLRDHPERGRAARAMLHPRHSTHEAAGRAGAREPVKVWRVDSA